MRRLVFALVVASTTTLWAHAGDAAGKRPAAEKRFAITEKDASPDYQIQGEYASAKLGAQVISLGGGQFRTRLYPGGLPGAGWNGQTGPDVQWRASGDKHEFQGDGGLFSIESGALKQNGKTIAERLVRASPTLGAKPPAGAVVLFDGTSTKAWRSTRMRDRLLQVGGYTVDKFQDFELHLEFVTPFMPSARGQDRGNSGIFLQRRYEIQILDSFGLEGADNECGGIYHFRRPDVNMCFPPLVWQTFDIDFRTARFDDKGGKTKNARVTVRHNGVVVHEDVELAGPSGSGQPETPEGGPLFLQWHGTPVQFRNIWIVPRS